MVYEDVAKKRMLVLNYNEDRRLLFYFVNGESDSYEEGGWQLGNEDSTDPDELRFLIPGYKTESRSLFDTGESIDFTEGALYKVRVINGELAADILTTPLQHVRVPLNSCPPDLLMHYIPQELIRNPLTRDSHLDEYWRSLKSQQILEDASVLWLPPA